MKDITREERVAQFLRAAGKRPWDFSSESYDRSFENTLLEEVGELVQAMREYVDFGSEEARANLCKEWADAQVVLSNVAWYLNIPADPAFNRVHENNMTKVVDGKVRFREDGKILKPDNYVKPNMKGL